MSAFLDYEKQNNRFLKLLQNDFGYRNIVSDNEDVIILAPHDHSISKMSFTIPDSFVRTHIAKFNEKTKNFVTLNHFKGHIEEKDEEIEVVIKGEIFHVLRRGDMQLYAATIPLYIISSPIVYQDCEWEVCSPNPPKLTLPKKESKKKKKGGGRSGGLVVRKKKKKKHRLNNLYSSGNVQQEEKETTKTRSRSPSPKKSVEPIVPEEHVTDEVTEPTIPTPNDPSEHEPKESPIESPETVEEPKIETENPSTTITPDTTSETPEEDTQAITEEEKGRPLITTYKDFVLTLRKVELAKVVKSIKRFVIEIKKSTNNDFPNPHEAVRKFIDGMTYAIHIHPSISGLTEEEEEAVREGLEKYLLTKLYERLFVPANLEEVNKDERFRTKLNRLQNLKPENCDVEPDYVTHPFWERAVEELRRINNFHTPRDKCICILNSVNLLFEVLKDKRPSETPKGADDFMPLLMFLILKANPPSIYLNLNYIQNYRNPDKLHGTEAGWAITNLEASIHYWEQIGPKTASKMLKLVSNLEIEAMLRGESFYEMGDVEGRKSQDDEDEKNENKEEETEEKEIKDTLKKSSLTDDPFMDESIIREELAAQAAEEEAKKKKKKKKKKKFRPLGFGMMDMDLYDDKEEKKKEKKKKKEEEKKRKEEERIVKQKKEKQEEEKKLKLELEKKEIESLKEEVEKLRGEKDSIFIILNQVVSVCQQNDQQDDGDEVKEEEEEEPFSVEGIQSHEDLRIGDIRKLFSEFKKVHHKFNQIKNIVIQKEENDVEDEHEEQEEQEEDDEENVQSEQEEVSDVSYGSEDIYEGKDDDDDDDD